MSGARPTGGDERVEAGVAAFMDARRRLWMPADLVRAILAAADAVAAQDPAPRAQPAAWTLVLPNGRLMFTNRSRALPDAWAERKNGTVRALYFDRGPAPTPVVPDEADQATADLREVLRWAPRVRLGVSRAAHEARARLDAHLDGGGRVAPVPPTGGAS